MFQFLSAGSASCRPISDLLVLQGGWESGRVRPSFVHDRPVMSVSELVVTPVPVLSCWLGVHSARKSSSRGSRQPFRGPGRYCSFWLYLVPRFIGLSGRYLHPSVALGGPSFLRGSWSIPRPSVGSSLHGFTWAWSKQPRLRWIFPVSSSEKEQCRSPVHSGPV